MEINIGGLKVDAGGGAGSRGGKIIGHTKSGKPIYFSRGSHQGAGSEAHTSTMSKHAGFSSDEHREASKLHEKLYRKHQSTRKGFEVRGKGKDKGMILKQTGTLSERVKHSELSDAHYTHWQSHATAARKKDAAQIGFMRKASAQAEKNVEAKAKERRSVYSHPAG